jgi:hypothetical protein
MQVLMLVFLALATTVIALPPPPLPAGYVQTMLDEFEGTTINQSLWTAARTTHLNACYTPAAVKVCRTAKALGTMIVLISSSRIFVIFKPCDQAMEWC